MMVQAEDPTATQHGYLVLFDGGGTPGARGWRVLGMGTRVEATCGLVDDGMAAGNQQTIVPKLLR